MPVYAFSVLSKRFMAASDFIPLRWLAEHHDDMVADSISGM